MKGDNIMIADIINFLQVNSGTIIVGAIVFIIIFFAFKNTFIKKHSCNGECGSCKGCH